MSKLKKEVSCIIGTYTNAQGQSKNRYQRIGSIIETKNGDMLKLDQMPLIDGGWNGWAYINDPRQEEQGRSEQPRKSDDVPFWWAT